MTMTKTKTKTQIGQTNKNISRIRDHFDIPRLNRQGIYYYVNLNNIYWFYKDNWMVKYQMSDNRYWTTNKLIILARIFKADPELEVIDTNLVRSKYGQFELDNPFRCDMYNGIKTVGLHISEKVTPEPDWNTHWLSKNGPVPYEKLTNQHIANILKGNFSLTEGIKSEVVKRFGLDIIGLGFAKKYACSEGIENFMSWYGYEGRVCLAIHDLIDKIDFHPQIRIILGGAIEFYDRLYND